MQKDNQAVGDPLFEVLEKLYCGLLVELGYQEEEN